MNNSNSNGNGNGNGTIVTISSGFTISGGLWLIAWLFSIGYAHLSFGQGVLALLIWPYYVGDIAGPH